MTAHPINPNYEYIQYNKDLTLIRSIKDNMFQIQSVMNCLPYNASKSKNVNRYFEDPDTIELFDGFIENLSLLKNEEADQTLENAVLEEKLGVLKNGDTDETPENAVLKEKLRVPKNREADQTPESDAFRGKLKKEKCEQIPGIYEVRNDVANKLKGTYIHRTLINDFAGWYSKKYKLKLLKFLDDYFQTQMRQLKLEKEELTRQNKDLTEDLNAKTSIVKTKTTTIKMKDATIKVKDDTIKMKDDTLDEKGVRTNYDRNDLKIFYDETEDDFLISSNQSKAVKICEKWYYKKDLVNLFTFPMSRDVKKLVKEDLGIVGSRVKWEELADLKKLIMTFKPKNWW